MKRCTNETYLYEIPDGCMREHVEGCKDCEYYKEPEEDQNE